MTAWLDVDPRPLDWNGPIARAFTRFPDGALERPIVEQLEQTASLHRDRVALQNSVATLTYGELWDGLCGLAETLETASQPGDRIGLRLPVSPRSALAMLACLAAGRPFVALDADHPQDWLDRALQDAQPKLIIDEHTVFPERAREGWRPASLDVDEPACVLFTSGSTGRPKAIVNSQRNLLQRVAQSINAAHVNAQDRFLTLASPCTIVGVRDVMTALLAGASIHLLDPQRTGAREILNVIHDEAITILFAFPALLRTVVAASPERAAPDLRLVRVGGDTTMWSDIDSLRAWLAPDAHIQSIYAATEAPMLQWFVDDSCRGEDARVPIGYPLPGNRLAIVDADGNAVPSGSVGELIVSSPYVSLGCPVFRTGDLVRQRPDGLLERLGRQDRQVKIRGVRVHLEGVEALLREHAFVRDVAALNRGETTLVAYVCAKDGAPAGWVAELRALMRSAPAPMRPARFYLTAAIPRLPNSKLDVHALMTLDHTNLQRERAKPPALTSGDRIVQAVSRAWGDALLAPVSAPHDDFFDAGGDSLKAITFATALERALGLEVSPTLIYETPGFSEFCDVLREYRAPRHGPLVSLKAGTSAPPLFVIHGVGGHVVELLPTARRMAYPGAVIGIRARGLARGEKPHWRIEAMAQDYLAEIKARQPRGPYFLCGYSSGGLVAFEIARRFEESGEGVGFVGLLDTSMSILRWPLRAWLSVFWRGIARFPGNLRVPRALPARVLGVAAAALIASARYRPGFYRGTLTLFTPTCRNSALPSPEAIWSRHARALTMIATEGDHLTMLAAPNADSTAESLTQSLRAHLSSGVAISR